MTKKFIALFLLSSFAFAGKGSVYSRFGVGEINTFLSGKNVGMGNTGIALFGETHVNFLNPAAAANINRTILSASYQYNTLTSEDASGSSLIGTGNITSFGLAMPVYSLDKMVLTLGILPYSSVGFEQKISSTVGTHTINQSFEGRGGISSGQAGISYGVTTDLVVGVTGHYLFGSIFRDQTVSFPSEPFFGGSYNQTISLSGFAATVGGIYSGIDKALGFSTQKRLNVGATFFTGASLDYDQQTLRNFSITQDTLNNNNQTISLPLGFSFGAAYLQNKTVYAADVNFQNWGNYSFNGATDPDMQNSIRLSAGVEFLPTSDFVSDDFWKRVSYRFGGSFRMTNLKVNGESINEMFATTGFTFPMSIETRIHLGLEYGIRGTTSALLVKDSILRFTFTLSASELMFIQPPIE